MPIKRIVKSKSAKRRDTKSQQSKTGDSAKNQSVKGASAIIHQRKVTQIKNYERKGRGTPDLKGR